MTAPNIITLLRLLCVPFFVVYCAQADYLGYLYATIILGMMELSDLLDGHVARRFNQGSRLGKLLDPMADSISRFSIFLTFFKVGAMPFWMVFVFFLRDMSVAYYRAFSAAEGVVIGARPSGKVKALTQAFGSMFICLMLVWSSHGEALATAGAEGREALLSSALWAQCGLGLVMMIGILMARLSPILLGSCLGFLFLFNGALLLPYWMPELGAINAPLNIDVTLYIVVAVTLYSFVDYTLGFTRAMFTQSDIAQDDVTRRE